MTLKLTGCCYAFTYGGGSPEHAGPNVRVDAFKDLSGEGWPAAITSERLRQRLGPPRAGETLLVLEGELLSISAGNIPVARPDAPPDRPPVAMSVVRVRGRARLKDTHGRLIRELGEQEGQAEMTVGRSVSETEDMRRLALERAAQELGDNLAELLLAAR